MGKVIAGFFGFILGSALNIGLFGFTFGLWVGHQFDEALRKNILLWTTFTKNADKNHSRIKIYDHLFGILGHIAKSDGFVSKKEIDVTNDLMGKLNIYDENQKKHVQKAFNNGKKQSFPLHTVLVQVQMQCLINPQLKQYFMQAIAAMRQTDPPIHPNKERLINHILQQLNISFQQQGQRYSSYNNQQAPSQLDYKLLGVDLKVDKENLKKAYRRLMHKHHPDRLSAQGASETDIKLATTKTQEIKAAYERICEAKGF